MGKINSDTAIEYLAMQREDRAEKCHSEDTLSVQAYDVAIQCISERDAMRGIIFEECKAEILGDLDELLKEYAKDYVDKARKSISEGATGISPVPEDGEDNSIKKHADYYVCMTQAIVSLTDRFKKMELPEKAVSSYVGVWDVIEDTGDGDAKEYNCRQCCSSVAVKYINGSMKFCPNCGHPMVLKKLW